MMRMDDRPRYALALFPLFFLLGRAGAWWRLAIGATSIALLCALTARFVLGQWAF